VVRYVTGRESAYVSRKRMWRTPPEPSSGVSISERIAFAMTSISINRNDSSARSSLLFQPHHRFTLPATNRLTPR
jgi:hypothetical protein